MGRRGRLEQQLCTRPKLRSSALSITVKFTSGTALPCGLEWQQLHYGDCTGSEERLSPPHTEAEAQGLRERGGWGPGAVRSRTQLSPLRSFPSPPQRPPFPVTLAPGTMDALIVEQAVCAQGRPSPEC